MDNWQQQNTHPVVSDPGERLILVDEDDRPCGRATKRECHEGDGLLHRAFSVFVVNRAGRVLMQQRSEDKLLWPLFWSNACCSHPRVGESMEVATQRRLQEELGITCDLDFLFKFRYQARYSDAGSEREFCWVYIGCSDDPVMCNRNEIASWCFIEPETLSRLVGKKPQWFTPWFRMEWQRIVSDFPDRLEALTAGRQQPLRASVTL